MSSHVSKILFGELVELRMHNLFQPLHLLHNKKYYQLFRYSLEISTAVEGTPVGVTVPCPSRLVGQDAMPLRALLLLLPLSSLSTILAKCSGVVMIHVIFTGQPHL